jgi:putative ABC transport system permease protein
MTVAVVKLAFAGIGQRKLDAALTLLIVTIAAATLAVALNVRAVAEEPWERTFAATRGADVVAFSSGHDLRPLIRAPGVTAAAGPFPAALTSLRHQGKRYGVLLQARPQTPTQIERPLMSDGTWLGQGAIVLERSYARALGVRTGESVTVAGASRPVELVVAGTALTTTQQRYPESQPGLGWVLPATLAEVQPDHGRRSAALFLRLEDRAAAPAFAERARVDYPPGSGVALRSWRELRGDALADTRVNQVIFATFSILIALGVGFALATTIGGRVLAQSRELGMLKAIGFTPRQVATVFLVENGLLGAAGALAGAIVGAVISPAFVSTSVELLGATPEPSYAPLRLGLAVLGVVAVVAIFSFVPAWLRAKATTAAMLTPAPSARRSRLHAFASRIGLPVVALVGFKDAFARPGRAGLTALGLSLAVAVLVAALAMEATFALATEPAAPTSASPVVTDAAGEPLAPDPAPASSDEDRLRPLVYGLDAIVLAIALVSLVTTSVLGARERARELGILKAVGFTPRQLVAALAANQLLLAAVALALGVPLGLAVFRGAYEAANGSSEAIGTPPLWQLLLLCPVAGGAFAALAGVAARRVALATVVDALRRE